MFIVGENIDTLHQDQGVELYVTGLWKLLNALLGPFLWLKIGSYFKVLRSSKEWEVLKHPLEGFIILELDV